MVSLPQIRVAGSDVIAMQDTAVAETREVEKTRDRKQSDIEFAGPRSEDTIPAVVDIHGDVIKADWHAIRVKANESEEYEHSLGLWQAMKTYKKVP